jgi:16S rRNA (cytidine1402-2'-O)-methyltransferase
LEPSKTKAGCKPASHHAPGLYLVATPIGNLGDITLRALALLGEADLVACEDTRTTGRLLIRHGITARLIPYHDHNAERVRPGLIARLKAGERIVLVSDAGTPVIADPGYKLVRAAIEAGVTVSACPGPSAPLMALILSGLPTDRFVYLGFLPSKAGQRRAAIAEFGALKASLVMLEAPHRLSETLADLAALLGERPAAVARELTKLHEEVRRAPLGLLAQHYREAGPPKGELVIVVGPPVPGQPVVDDAALDERLSALLKNVGVREAAERLAQETGLPRRALYRRALALREGAGDA